MAHAQRVVVAAESLKEEVASYDNFTPVSGIFNRGFEIVRMSSESLSGMHSKIGQDVADLHTFNSSIDKGLDLLSLVFEKYLGADDHEARMMLLQLHDILRILSMGSLDFLKYYVRYLDTCRQTTEISGEHSALPQPAI